MTNKTASFEVWMKEVESLCKKVGHPISDAECRWIDYYEYGFTPQKVLAVELTPHQEMEREMGE
jgi:hypothetical protein